MVAHQPQKKYAVLDAYNGHMQNSIKINVTVINRVKYQAHSRPFKLNKSDHSVMWTDPSQISGKLNIGETKGIVYEIKNLRHCGSIDKELR